MYEVQAARKQHDALVVKESFQLVSKSVRLGQVNLPATGSDLAHLDITFMPIKPSDKTNGVKVKQYFSVCYSLVCTCVTDYSHLI